VASLTFAVRAAGRNSAMQADKSVFCAQAAGASQETANTALMQAARTRAEVRGVDGCGVMKKIPGNLNVSECISMRASECTVEIWQVTKAWRWQVET
jgi:hypothetical protein